jgi:hypothetical protein
MASTPDGRGYWLVASDGGVFSFGDADYQGSTGSMRLNAPIIGMAAAPGGGGYWLVASDGGIFAFSAPFLGSAGGAGSGAPIAAIVATAHGFLYPPGSTGYDISRFQCGTTLPAVHTVSIVEIAGAIDGTLNPCFAQQVQWAGPYLSLYLFMDQVPTNNPPQAMSGPAGNCLPGDEVCQGYNWGWYWAGHWADVSTANGVQAGLWWLDIEGPCGFSVSYWQCGPAGMQSNAQVILGAMAALRQRGIGVGVYSTWLQWPLVAGSLMIPGVPIWIAGATSAAQQVAFCTDPAQVFGGGRPALVQWPGSLTPSQLDQDYTCGQ